MNITINQLERNTADDEVITAHWNAIANAAWTADVVTAYETMVAAQNTETV